MPGPDLPMALENHAMVAINNTCSMVIAGLDIDWEESALTYFYDHNEGEFVKKQCKKALLSKILESQNFLLLFLKVACKSKV